MGIPVSRSLLLYSDATAERLSAAVCQRLRQYFPTINLLTIIPCSQPGAARLRGAYIRAHASLWAPCRNRKPKVKNKVTAVSLSRTTLFLLTYQQTAADTKYISHYLTSLEDKRCSLTAIPTLYREMVEQFHHGVTKGWIFSTTQLFFSTKCSSTTCMRNVPAVSVYRLLHINESLS